MRRTGLLGFLLICTLTIAAPMSAQAAEEGAASPSTEAALEEDTETIAETSETEPPAQDSEQNDAPMLTENSEQTEGSELTENSSQTKGSELTENFSQTEGSELTEDPDHKDSAELSEAPEQEDTSTISGDPALANQSAPEAADETNSDEPAPESAATAQIVEDMDVIQVNSCAKMALTAQSASVTNAGKTADRLHFIALNDPHVDSDSILIESNGLYGLIDASNPSGLFNDKYGFKVDQSNGMTVVKYLTDLNVTHLQFVLATHSHTDHIGGIPDVAASGLVNQDTVYIYKTYNLNPYAQPTWHNDYYYNLALDAMKAKGATLLNVLDPNTVALAKLGATFVNVPASDSNKTDEHIDFTMGDFLIKLFNLHTESLLNENLNAIVTTVTKDNSRAVLMSDMEMDEYKESKIVNAILSEDSTTPVDVYQVGHHGYYTSTSVDTINAMKAKNYVISTIDRGAIPFEHTYFNYYMEKTGKVYRTSQNGKAVVAEFGDSGVSMLKMDNTAKALTSTAFPWVAAITDGWHDWYPNEKSWNERKEKGVSWIYIQSKKPVNGWVLWNGGWYYCNQYGTMLTGWVLADNNWYLLDEKGIMRTGWVYSNGKWYYLNQKGIMQTGVQTIGSTKYCFNNQGVMQTGWTYYGGKWYFANSSGGLQIGWKQDGGKWYLLGTDGAMKTGWAYTGGKRYYLNKSGAMLTGWQRIDGKWYLLGTDGAMQTGWRQDGGKWYLLGSDGVMKTGWQKVGGKTYFFNNSGAMQTGWISFGGKWYYANGSGAIQTGWRQDGGKWYLLGSDGVMKTGWQKTGGKTYFFNNSGAMQTGWISFGGKWYYASGSGAMQTGWRQDGGKWYLLGSDGVMKTGWQKVGGKTYFFNGSGVMLTGWINSAGKWYYLDSSGAMVANKWVGDYFLKSNGEMAVNTWIGSYYVGKDGKWIPGAKKAA